MLINYSEELSSREWLAFRFPFARLNWGFQITKILTKYKIPQESKWIIIQRRASSKNIENLKITKCTLLIHLKISNLVYTDKNTFFTVEIAHWNTRINVIFSFSNNCMWQLCKHIKNNMLFHSILCYPSVINDITVGSDCVNRLLLVSPEMCKHSSLNVIMLKVMWRVKQCHDQMSTLSLLFNLL